MNPTERASHPSRNQVELLLEFLEKYPNLAKGFSKVPSARDASRKAWEGLIIKLNSLGGCVKTWKQWTKYWADKKSAVKKKVSLRYKARNKTGSGFESVVELSEVEERIVALMGGESFSIGDRHLEINPFPEPTNSSPSLLGHNNSIPSLAIQNPTESSTISLIDVDVFTPTVETPLQEFQLECVAGTSYTSARPSGAHLVIQSSQEAQTPPRARPPSPLQPPTPSGSGTYTGRRRLNFSGVQGHTASSIRQHRRYHRASPSSQQQSQFVNILERFLKLEEQRLQLERCHYERMAGVLKDIAEGIGVLKDLAEGIGVLKDIVEGIGVKKDLPEGIGVLKDIAEGIGVLKDIAEGIKLLAEALSKKN